MTIEEAQDILFDDLKIFDRICQENNIRYYLSGGSAIGAVREKDFIAWDDDVDIDICGEDYPRFKQIMREKLPDYLELIEPQDFSPYFYDFVIRIIDKRWLLRDEKTEDIAYNNYQNRIGIDVFLCCKFPKGIFGQKLFIIMLQILYGMCMAYRYKVDFSKYSLIEKMEVAFLRTIGRIYSGKNPKRIIQRWFQFIQCYERKETGMRYTVNTLFKKMYMISMPERWFGKPMYGYIRGKAFPIFTNYDEVLRKIYGDYMTPERNSEKYITHV